MKSTITLNLVPDNDMSESDMRSISQEAKRRGISPEEFVTKAIQKAIAAKPKPARRRKATAN